MANNELQRDRSNGLPIRTGLQIGASPDTCKFLSMYCPQIPDSFAKFDCLKMRDLMCGIKPDSDE